MSYIAPDFEDHFKSDRFSDVIVEIYEEDVESGQRKRETTIPGHSMVLMAFSNYCKVKLTHWTTESSSETGALIDEDAGKSRATKHTIELPVPSGQTETAMHLVQGMYQKTPAVSHLNHQQLLQLLLLADRFEVPKVQLAVLEAFAAMSVHELQWDTALALLDLPASCADQAGCKQVCDLAIAKLMQKLGDLEQVWADEQLQNLLLSLPFSALLRLVQHNELCIAHERTVVFTIRKWWQKDRQQMDITLLKQLMQQVRMQHLGQLYIATVMMNRALFQKCFSVSEFGIACMCADPSSLSALQDANCAELQNHPAWTAPRRQVSSKQQVVDWKLPLTEFQEAVKQDAGGTITCDLFSQPTVLQGLTVQLRAQVTVIDASNGQGECHHFGVIFRFRGLPNSGVCRAKVTFTILARQLSTAAADERYGVDQPPDLFFGPCKQGFSSDAGWGYRNMVPLGSISSWSDIEAALRAKKLVQDDDCLHIRAQLLEAS